MPPGLFARYYEYHYHFFIVYRSVLRYSLVRVVLVLYVGHKRHDAKR